VVPFLSRTAFHVALQLSNDDNNMQMSSFPN
jgi:hypothetical protein